MKKNDIAKKLGYKLIRIWSYEITNFKPTEVL